MWTSSELKALVSALTECARGVSHDHQGGPVSLAWNMWTEEGMPSIASGAGRATEMVMFSSTASFTTALTPEQVSRSRPFSWHLPGTDNQGSAPLDFSALPDASSGKTSVNLYVKVHVANEVSSSWGIFSKQRDRKILSTIQELHQFMKTQPVSSHYCEWDTVLSETR